MAKKYEWLGYGIEEMTLGTAYNSNSVKDVRGDTKFTTTKGETTVSVTPVEFNAESEFAKFIDTAVEREYELSQLDKPFICVKMYKRIGADYEAGKPAAWRQIASVPPGDFAPGNEALQVSGTLNFHGQREFGTFDGKIFVPETAPPEMSEIHYKEGAASRSDFRIYYEYDDGVTPEPAP